MAEFSGESNLMRNVVNQIVFKIRNEHDLNEAANILLNNNMTFEQLINSTMRLNIYDIAKLADITSKIHGKG
mgnify:CR=1 FL=1